MSRHQGVSGSSKQRATGWRCEELAREVLLKKVWGSDSAGDSRTVDIHIRLLRAKSERDPADPRHIITVRGVGYRFEEETTMRAGGRHTVPRT